MLDSYCFKCSFLDKSNETFLFVDLSEAQKAVKNSNLKQLETSFTIARNRKVKNYENQSLLHMALIIGNTEIIHFLLNKLNPAEQDINEGDNNGFTPLHFASENGHLDAVKLLIAAGAIIDSRNKNFNTPLNLAIKIVKILREKEEENESISLNRKLFFWMKFFFSLFCIFILGFLLKIILEHYTSFRISKYTYLLFCQIFRRLDDWPNFS